MVRGAKERTLLRKAPNSILAVLQFTLHVDARPLKLYYAHHIQDLTDRSGEWVFPGTESA
jgi:hypothetical protein